MKFQVAKRDLEEALKVVLPSLSSSGSDLSTHFLFRFRPDLPAGADPVVEVLTYSGRIFSSAPVKAKVLDQTQTAFSIEGRRLKKWLAVVPDAALEFGFDGTVVAAKAPRGTQKFPSLDPTQFPPWDKQIAEAKVTATLSAKRLAVALDYAKRFVSDKEGTEPNLCVVEVKKGLLYATDRRAITLVRAAGLENAGFRIHGKSLGGFQTFLGTFPSDTDVSILEHDRSVFMRRGDGAVFGEALFQARFPDLNVNMDEANHHSWAIGREDVLECIGFLTAGAADEDTRLRVNQRGGQVVLAMTNQTGDDTELLLDPKEMTSDATATPLPASGFLLNSECLTRILSAWKTQDDVRVGINLMQQTQNGKSVLRGYLRFANELDGDKFLTIHAWLR
ncbi:MAG: hypothetical protein A2Y38_08155 [Spirochaetes bacterium GWB1_59_5]|nr:MAG: hypothetical protein A2Y38_08155 [Spirochaetes bacterium GWB1_59_5]